MNLNKGNVDPCVNKCIIDNIFVVGGMSEIRPKSDPWHTIEINVSQNFALPDYCLPSAHFNKTVQTFPYLPFFLFVL